MKNILLVMLTIIAALLSAFLLSPWPVWLGTLAAWVTTGSFCLQVLHIIKNKDTSGLSLGMWGALFFGVSCWAWYGFRMSDIPVMTANGITALLALAVILLKLWHERPVFNKNSRRLVRMPRVILKPRIRRLRPLKTPDESRLKRESK
ncbi:SemiSWEET family sugar transporter [Pantoea vagans]|uniref:SemiSWEET family sugar transporter n=1 Tax=Pantoea vagans TaxID=470934 RepID=UPI0023AFBA89|nr:SemiSWEET family transporter [Pantoea vagans]MDE8559422.1 SemiSWEET family transporter [Pantoea vagans]MDE8579417.1 SemiSWEET family transporter [Pantoea vagans]